MRGAIVSRPLLVKQCANHDTQNRQGVHTAQPKPDAPTIVPTQQTPWGRGGQAPRRNSTPPPAPSQFVVRYCQHNRGLSVTTSAYHDIRDSTPGLTRDNEAASSAGAYEQAGPPEVT